MPAFAAFLDVDLFSSGDYRLVNTSLPVCLLDSKHGGDTESDALTPATLTIAGGKIHQIAVGPQANAIVNENLPAIDLDGGMVWPVCADLHTHLDKGQTWFRAPNTSGSWRNALEIVGKDREANWSAEDVDLRMDFAFAAPSRTAPRRSAPISIRRTAKRDQLAGVHADADRWAGRIALQGVRWR